jgi:hypothetical protein
MIDQFTALHGLAIKKFGTAAAVASILSASEDEVATALADATAIGEAIAARGAYMVTPKGQAALKGEYALRFAALRADESFVAAHERFEAVNTDLKQLMTEWQVRSVAGEPLPNDHSDKDYDARIIDRLGALHERAEPVLVACVSALPRLERYAVRLGEALEKAEEGIIEFVSGAKIDSYHTVWFELHEDLLRILDRSRAE